MSDGAGGSASATVSITVRSVNDPPVAVADAAATPQDTAVVIDVRAYVGPDAFSYTVSDGAGGTDTGSVAITVTSVPDTNSIHVGDLDGSSGLKGKNRTARVTIRIKNATHGAVANATVTGTWSDGATGSANCRTSVGRGAPTTQRRTTMRMATARGP